MAIRQPVLPNVYLRTNNSGKLWETRSVKIGRGVRQVCCLSPIVFNLYSEYLIEEALEGFGDFKRAGK
jgi:hypothetical protein